MNTLSIPTSRSQKPVVILSGLTLQAKSSTAKQVSAAAVMRRLARLGLRALSALFSAKVSGVVAIATLGAMLWHNIAIADVLEAQRAVATDCILALPWLAAVLYHNFIKEDTADEKGGRK